MNSAHLVETHSSEIESHGAADELLLQQLQQAQYWRNRIERTSKSGTISDSAAKEQLPQTWELTNGIELHAWQESCVNSWFRSSRRGVIKVVTGAGKTILALAIAEKLQNSTPNLRVAVVVPTVVLLEQWREEFLSRSNLPPSAIGMMGGGHRDSFTQGIRVLVCVLNSAATKLPKHVEESGIGDDLLLIVDECHRAGASTMKKVFNTRRAFSLGLSATPERDNEPTDDEEIGSNDDLQDGEEFDETVLGKELGPIVFEMNYADAISQGVLPPFRIVHYGLSLSAEEREKYDRISRRIVDLRKELETGTRRGLALIKWCRSAAGASNSKAVQLLSLTSERKRLVYRVQERYAAVLAILENAFRENPDSKAILFHESIEEVMRLFDDLRAAGFEVVAEHSQFPDAIRAESLRLFRKGTARVIVSAKSLIEGFNVPSADIGIIVAASSSVRQRVQTLGRLLRRNRNTEGNEKQASLYVLYAANTVDELIYEKANWEEFVGADRNEYNRWDDVVSTEPHQLDAPPRSPAIDERAVNEDALVVGEVYPGDSDQGKLFSLDTQGTVTDEAGNLVRPHAQLMSVLAAYQRTGGRFRITPEKLFVTKLDKDKEGWRAIFLGRLRQPVEIVVPNEDDVLKETFNAGDSYPLSNVQGKKFSVLQRDKRLIARKVEGRTEFVIPTESIDDSEKKTSLALIQRRLADAYAKGHRISKITVTPEGHVVYVFNGNAHFVGHAPEGADGFIFEQKVPRN